MKELVELRYAAYTINSSPASKLQQFISTLGISNKTLNPKLTNYNVP